MEDDKIIRALNEWMARYINDPSAFNAEFQTVIEYLSEKNNWQVPSYGRSCLAYMQKIDEELG